LGTGTRSLENSCYSVLPVPSRKGESQWKKEFEKLAIVIAATILVARKLAMAPRNSPAYVSAIADAVSDARRIVEKADASH
jgi:hypothetical protein